MPPGKKGKINQGEVRKSWTHVGVTVLSANKVARTAILLLAYFNGCLRTCSFGWGRGFHYLLFWTFQREQKGREKGELWLLGRGNFQREKGGRIWLLVEWLSSERGGAFFGDQALVFESPTQLWKPIAMGGLAFSFSWIAHFIASIGTHMMTSTVDELSIFYHHLPLRIKRF